MIQFEHFELSNGLRVFVHEDPNTTVAAFNLCYNVGSRDENPDKTGFAHLFEHLMFGGSGNIPSYDEPLQKVGAQNNAFTSPDITNYYITLPTQNIETAFWIESDRMKALSFDPKVLDVQKKVVVEEFKQRYLNQPYGDIWLELRPLVYQVHPYQWATIGKEISHIENASMQDVKDFFYEYYRPNNAVLAIGGNVKTSEIEKLAQKWFGDIEPGVKKMRNLPVEPTQARKRILELERKVPANALYMVYHIPEKYGKDYLELDLWSDYVGSGKSALLHQKLVKEQSVFTQISASQMGSLDPGMLIIGGMVAENVDIKEAEGKVLELLGGDVPEMELKKLKNQCMASEGFSEVTLLNRTMKIAFAANGGHLDMLERELQLIDAINADDVKSAVDKYIKVENVSTLYYHAVN